MEHIRPEESNIANKIIAFINKLRLPIIIIIIITIVVVVDGKNAREPQRYAICIRHDDDNNTQRPCNYRRVYGRTRGFAGRTRPTISIACRTVRRYTAHVEY